MEFIHSFWSTSLALAPWLFLGAFLSALLHVFLPKDFISRQLQGSTGIFRAVFLGVPLPLCSCGVIPAGIGLKKDGASDSSAVAFLISTPQTGVDSVLVSAAFLGWPFAIFKLLSATLTGIVGGHWVEYATESQPMSDHMLSAAPKTDEVRTWMTGVDHGVQLIRSIWLWLLFGIVLSAALQSLIPTETFASVKSLGQFGAALAALAISTPIYVCATASVPIAAALVQAGLPLGAALVFLMAGPATNVATIGAIRGAFGSKVSVIYLLTVVLGSIGLGLGFDALFGQTIVVEGFMNHSHGAWWQTLSAVLLMISFGYFAYEEWGQRTHTHRTDDTTIDIEGLHCGGCVNKLQRALDGVEGVLSAHVSLKPQRAVVHGNASKQAILLAIESVGLVGRFQDNNPILSFSVEGLNCGACVSKLKKSLENIEGAYGVTVTLEPPKLSIQGVSEDAIQIAVERVGCRISSEIRSSV